jgi:RNA polymerase sigma-70 factor (ECF subfamily)
MSESSSTRLTLLVRLRDVQDAAAWEEFVEIYAPLIYGLARRHGFQDADASDLTQEVLRAAVTALPTFTLDRKRGSFRGWLFTVARNELRKLVLARKRQPQGSGSAAAQEFLEGQPAPREDESVWNQEYQTRLFTWAAGKARPNFRESTWQAFWRTAVEGQDVALVAEALGLSIGAVYVAKSRVLARIQELVEAAQSE